MKPTPNFNFAILLALLLAFGTVRVNAGSFTKGKSLNKTQTVRLEVSNVTDSTTGQFNNFCAATTLAIDWQLTGGSISGPFSLLVQLSDYNGSFANPLVISPNITTVSGVTSGTLYAVLPVSILRGTNYRLRVVTTVPNGTISVPYPTQLIINNPISGILSLDSGLVGYWPLDGFINDLSINGNNGNAYGNILPTTDHNGNPGKAMLFDGRSSYVEIPNSPSLASPNQELTVCLWIYINNDYNNTGWVPIGAKSNNSSPGQYWLELNVIQNIMQSSFHGSRSNTPFDFMFHQWYFLTITSANNLVNYYVNGLFIGQRRIVFSNVDNTLPLEFGRHTPGATEYLDGKLDELRIYNRALNGPEIQYLYNGGLGGSNSPLCFGNDLNLRAIGGTNVQYQWTGPNNFSSTKQNPTIPNVTDLNAGTYQLSITDGICNTPANTVEVKVYKPSDVDSVFNGHSCGPGSCILKATGAPAGSFYRWYDSSGTNIVYESYQKTLPTGFLTQTTKYLVTIAGVSGCEGNRKRVTAYIGKSPGVFAIQHYGGLPGFCTGDSLKMTALPGYARYQWYKNGFIIPGATAQVYFGKTPDVFTVGVFDSSGCRWLSKRDTLYEFPNPNDNGTIGLPSNLAVCAGTSTALTLSHSQNGISYQLQTITGQNIGPAQIGNTGNLVFNTPNLFYNQVFQVKASNPFTQCSIIMQVKPKVRVAGANPPDPGDVNRSICSGQDTIQLGGLTDSSYLYNWHIIAAPNPNGLFLSDSNAYKPLFSAINNSASPQQITMRLSGTDMQLGCGRDTIFSVTVFPRPARPSFLGATNTGFCPGDSAYLQASGPGPYLWSNGATTQLVWIKTGGKYSFVSYNGGSCPSFPSDTATVVSWPAPADTNLVQIPKQIFVCKGQTTKIALRLSEPGTSYRLSSFPGNVPVGNFLAGNGATLYFPVPPVTVNTQYQIAAVSANGCKKVMGIKPILFPLSLPVANPGLSQSVCSLGDTLQIGSANNPDYTYHWHWLNPVPGLGIYLSDSTAASPRLAFSGIISSQIVAKLRLTVKNVLAPDCPTDSLLQITIKTTPEKPVIAALKNGFCQTDSLRLFIKNPVAGYTYLWSTGKLGTAIYAKTAGKVSVIPIYNGCQGLPADSFMVQAFPPPGNIGTLTLPTLLNICEGVNAAIVLGNSEPGISYQLKNTEVTTSIGPPQIGNGNNLTFFTGNLLASDTFSMVATNPMTGCSTLLSIFPIIITNPVPVPNPGIGQTLCSETDTALLGGIGNPSIFSYSWSVPGSAGVPTWFSSVSVPNPQFVATNNGNLAVTLKLKLTVTNLLAPNCPKDSTVDITILPSPAKPIIQPNGNLNLCEGDSLDLLAPTGFGQYLWNTGQTSPGIRVGSAGFYKVKVWNGFNCFSTWSDSVKINIQPLPIVSLGPDTLICSCTLLTLGTNIQNGMLYQWSGSSHLLNPNSANSQFSFCNNGNNTVSEILVLKATNPITGCYKTDTIKVSVRPALNRNAGPDHTFCSGKTDTIGLIATPGYSYVWQPSVGLTNPRQANSGISLVNLTRTPHTIPYYRTATSGNCSEIDTVLVTVNPVPSGLTIIGPDHVCPGEDSLVYRVFAGNQSVPGSSFNWDITGGHLIYSQGDSALVRWDSTSGTGKISAVAQNSFACNGSINVLNVIRNTILKPQILIAGSALRIDSATGQVIAKNDSICLSDAGIVIYKARFANPHHTYTWTLPAAAIPISPTTGKGLSQIKVKWDSAGTFNIKLKETTHSADSCTGESVDFAIHIFENPRTGAGIQALNPNQDSVVCANVGTSGYELISGGSHSSFNWQISGGGLLLPYQPSDKSVSVQWLRPGQFQISVQETNSQGCAGPVIVKTVQVLPIPVPVIQTSDSGICPELLDSRVYTVVNPVPGSRLNWSLDSTTGQIVSGQGSSTVTVNWNLGGRKEIKVQETTRHGCQSAWVLLPLKYDSSRLEILSVSVAKDQLAEIVIGFNNTLTQNSTNKGIVLQSRIHGETAQWTDVTTLQPGQTQWSEMGKSTEKQSYQYRLSYTNGCGSGLFTPLQQSILLKSVAQDEYSKGIKLKWNSYVGWSDGPITYQVWRSINPADTLHQDADLGNLTDTTLVAHFAGESFYHSIRIKAQSANGLKYSWSNLVQLNFEHPLTVSTVITPNGDDKNEYLYLDNLGLYPHTEVKVFNRFGLPVFSATDYKNDWNGSDLPAGVYSYSVQTASGIVKSGWLTIIR